MVLSFCSFRNVCLIFLIILFTSDIAQATHLTGSEMTYKYLGPGNNNTNKFEIKLTIYQDCSGDTMAILEDNPMFLRIFDQDGLPYLLDSIRYSLRKPVRPTLQGCGDVPATFCAWETTFTETYSLPANKSYTAVVERCCRNGSIVNIVNSLQTGATYFCEIPSINSSLDINSSAVFDSLAPQMASINKPFVITCSANDMDGDSLSYEFSETYNGGSPNDAKPIPSPPPFASINYSYPFSYQEPVSGIQLDTKTGTITGTCTLIGKYLVAVACHEWRNGSIINTVRKEFEIICTAGANTLATVFYNTAVSVGTILNFHAPDGSLIYDWSPATYLSDTTTQYVTARFLDTGKHTITLLTLDTAGCYRMDFINVNVFDLSTGAFVPTAFSPNGDSRNEILKAYVKPGKKLQSFRVFTRYGMHICDCVDGWDGTYKGQIMPIGSYTWTATYIDELGMQRSDAGYVVLVR